MEVNIRRAVNSDKETFIDFAVKLSEYNRTNHKSECKYDNYEFVIDSIQRKASETFDNRNEDIFIFIAEFEGKPVGYALGRIFEEDSADNGTGRMGLFDELFVDDLARGLEVGQKLLDITISRMKEKGINRIKLHAYSWNNIARRLYEKNGFRDYAISYEIFL